MHVYSCSGATTGSKSVSTLWNVVIMSLNHVCMLQAAAETHIVTLAGPGEAPEWGCDDVWNGGDPVLENCTAVFGIMYRLGTPTTEPGYLETAVKEAPLVAGAEKPLAAGQLNLQNLIPRDPSYYTYVGSLVRTRCCVRSTCPVSLVAADMRGHYYYYSSKEQLTW